ncbi:MAG TPA: lysylphosphatidylglycerol synthase domain-containing protein [Nakamurella sp.]
MSEAEAASTPAVTDRAEQRARWRRVLVMAAKIVLVVGGVYLAVQALRAVDWAQVGDALARLTWWEIGVVVLLIAVRQSVNASTLPILIPGLTMPHALQTALSGTLIQTFTPPPADTVLRLSMLKSFGVETTRGASALVLDTIVFYLARFVAPLIGLVLTLFVLPVEGIQLWMAIGGLAAAALLVWAMVLISKGEKAAGNVGRVAALVVRRLRPTVDPEAWAAAVIRFQKESSSGIVSRMARATPTMLGFILVDAIVVVVCLRFVGIPGSDIGYLAVLAAMFTLYPLTIFPFAGLGVLDASLIVLINAEGVADPTDLVAALVIWRAATLLLPLLPGLLTLGLWRRRQAGAQTEM